MTMAGAIAFWKSGQPSTSNERDEPAWSNVETFVGLAFISASLGLQGVVGKRLNTAFGTTSEYASIEPVYSLTDFNVPLPENSRADYRLGGADDRPQAALN
jgi:hypothetical protein